MKKAREKIGQPGRWREADEKLSRLLAAGGGAGTEGLTEEELAAVSDRRFDKSDADTRHGIIRLALKLRSPLMAKRILDKAVDLDLDSIAEITALAPLAEDAPEWLLRAPEAKESMARLAGALECGEAVDAGREGELFAGMPSPLRRAAFESLARAVGEKIVPVARALTQRDPGLAETIAEWVADIPSPAVADYLLELLAVTSDKKQVKAIRRGIQNLRRRGIQVDLPQAGAPVYRPAEPAEPAAFVTGIDGHGARLIFLAQPRRPQGLHLFEALISDEKGLVELNAYETQRRGLEKFMGSLQERASLLLAETTPGHARHLIGAAMERNVRSGTQLPKGATELRAYWDVGDDAPVPLAEERLAAIRSDEDGSALAASLRLLDHEAFRGWYVAPDLVQPYVERARDASSSQIVLTPMQKNERLAGLVREATDAIFAPGGEEALRSRYAQRMREMAYLLQVRGETEPAAQARAVADRLVAPGASASMTPFVYALVEKTVAILTRDEDEKEKKAKDEGESPLIVKP